MQTQDSNPSNPLTMDSRKELLMAYEKWSAEANGWAVNLGMVEKEIDTFLSSLPPQGSESEGDFINTSRRVALSLLSEAMDGMNEGLKEKVSLFIQSQKTFLPEPHSPVGDNK